MDYQIQIPAGTVKDLIRKEARETMGVRIKNDQIQLVIENNELTGVVIAMKARRKRTTQEPDPPQE